MMSEIASGLVGTDAAKPCSATGPNRAPLSTSVIVCTASADRTELLLKCLRALQGGSRIPDQLIVVVDSNHALERSIRTLVSPEVEVVGNHGQSGLSAARNAGLAVATGEVVAFTDDDAIPDDMWLEHLMQPFAVADSVLGVGGRIEPAWEVTYSWLPAELLWIWGGTYKGHITEPGPIRNPYGGNMAFLRHAIVEAGGFSAQFGKRGRALATADETAFSLQIERVFGPGRIWYTPRALVLHHVPRARLSLRFFVRRCLSEGRSKAQLRETFGVSALSSERSFARNLVIRAVPRYLLSAVVRCDLDGVLSAATVIAGLSVTGFGFVTKSVSQRLHGRTL